MFFLKLKAIQAIGESLDDTWDILEILSGDTVDYVDDVAETVNITSRRIRYTLEEIIPILEDGEELSKSLNHGLNYLDDGFNNLEITSGKMADALDESQEAMKNLRKAIASGQDALYQTNHTLKRLLN